MKGFPEEKKLGFDRSMISDKAIENQIAHRIRRETYDTSLSIPKPPICDRNSTTVTCEPRRDHTEPYP
jgi:hypothetical protein